MRLRRQLARVRGLLCTLTLSAASASGAVAAAGATLTEPPTNAATAVAAATAAPIAMLHVTFTPDTLGQRTTVKFALRIGATHETPPPLSSLDFLLPNGMGIATTTLGLSNCAPASLIAVGLAGCSVNARLGYGTATAILPVGSRTVSEHASLTPLMGPPHVNHPEVLFYLQTRTPVFVQQILPGALTEAQSPFGEEIETSVPMVEAWPEGPLVGLRTFNSTLGPLHLTYLRRVGSRTVPFHPTGIRIPATCPRGGFPVAAHLSFVNGTHTTASYRVPCHGH